MSTAIPSPVPLDDRVRSAWERALALWGVRLNDPEIRPGAARHGGAPAWFDFPPSVTVDTEYLHEHGLDDELTSMFAHEIGHHVLAPSTRIDSLKIRHQMARALAATSARPVRQSDVNRLANLWTDLLVNTRIAQLQRAEDDAAGEPGIVRVGRVLYPAPGSDRRLWWVYCRAYELLWRLPAGTLCPPEAPSLPAPAAAEGSAGRLPPLSSIPKQHRAKERLLRERQAESDRIAAELAGARRTNPPADALLVAETVRTFLADPVSGAVRFGVIAAPYIVEEQESGQPRPGREGDTGAGCAADTEEPTAAELGRILADQRLRGDLPAHPGMVRATEDSEPQSEPEGASGQTLGLARTLELYRDIDEQAVLTAWYRTEAAAWVRPYTRPAPAQPSGGLPGPLELWESGDDLADIDWAATMRGGPVVPGVTTRRRSELDDEPVSQERGVDVDLYVDSSGSMHNPRLGSPAVLAGTILALSVLRGGGRVRVVSFSGPGQVAGMERFSRDPAQIIPAIAMYFGGGTTFPLDLYERRYAGLAAPSPEQQRHVVVLSDDGLTSMFGERNEQYEHVAREVRAKLTTGTLVLMDSRRRVAALAERDGYDVVYLRSMDDAPGACAELARRLREDAGGTVATGVTGVTVAAGGQDAMRARGGGAG